jgi:hypothetical protein
MISELYIENQRADISTTLASLLTFAIDDIKDFSSRQTAFSKTIILPGSQRNNKLFGSIFEVAITNDYDSQLPNININFNASVAASCLLFQDNMQVFKGIIRILQVNIDRGRVEYEAAISGELSSLSNILSGRLLEDLDFSAYDENWNETNIIASWDNPGGSGVYYPLADYGTYSVNKHDWDFRTMRPALYVKEYIDKIFEAADFRYSSNLFDSTRFKDLVIPHNQKRVVSLSSTAFAVDGTLTTYSGSGPTSTVIGGRIEFGTHITLGDFTASGSPSYSFTYGGSDPLIGDILINISGLWNNSASLTLVLKLNGVIIASNIVGGGGAFNYFTSSLNAYGVTINNTDVLYVEYSATLITGGAWSLQINSGTFWRINSSNTILVPLGYGELIAMNAQIPKNIRQVDFLLWIVKLFNLYITEDKWDERLLYIEPYVDYYSEESQNAVDWTYKLDRNSPVMIQPMSELNAKIYNFKYAADSDFYNDLYNKRYNQTYGSHIFDTQYDFATQTINIEIGFAGTPLVGYDGEEKIYPTIFKLSGTQEENTDSVIRILQTKKITGVSSWDILDGVTVLTSVTDYGYAGHFNDPDNVTNDLNFGPLQELFFVLVSGDLSVTQFNVYWSSYMAEITDKDSKLLTGKFYLTPKDILNLDFSKYVNVDGNLFRLNKISDYNLTKPDLATCELLKVLNTLY